MRGLCLVLFRGALRPGEGFRAAIPTGSREYANHMQRTVTIGVVVMFLGGLWAMPGGLAAGPAAKRPCAKAMVGKTAKGGTLKCRRVGVSFRWVAVPRKTSPVSTPTPVTSTPVTRAPATPTPAASTPAAPTPVTPAPPDPYPNETVSQRNARRSASNYLRFMAFSRSGLIGQLEYEGFSTADATYAVTILNPNWYQQAAAKAQEYLRVMPFSRTGLIAQLEYEGFTHDEAVYGVNSTGL